MKIIDLNEFIQLNREMISTIKHQYLELLSELTIVENLTDNVFIEKIESISKMGKIIIIISEFEIIATGTVIIEPKIIRNGKSVGHIEDIIVKSQHRGKKLSVLILRELKEYSKKMNCYKVILDCKTNLESFYEKNDFSRDGVQMVKYFENI